MSPAFLKFASVTTTENKHAMKLGVYKTN